MSRICGSNLLFLSLVVVPACGGGQAHVNSVTNPRAHTDRMILVPGVEFSTNQILRTTVEYKKDGINRSFHALVGGYPAGATARAEYRNPVPRINMIEGWVYEAGEWPMGETEYIDISADGCSVVIQVDGLVHRVFLLTTVYNAEVSVSPKNPAGHPPVDPTKWKATSEKYIEATRDAMGVVTISSLREVNLAPPAIKQFLQYVKDRGRDAQLKETTSW